MGLLARAGGRDAPRSHSDGTGGAHPLPESPYYGSFRKVWDALKNANRTARNVPHGDSYPSGPKTHNGHSLPVLVADIDDYTPELNFGSD